MRPWALSALMLLFISVPSLVEAQGLVPNLTVPCRPDDPACRPGHFGPAPGAIIDGGTGLTGHALDKAGHDVGKALQEAIDPISKPAVSDLAKPLMPVRAFLAAKDIPPTGAGAYGLVVLHSKPTAASRSKLLMVCKAFVAFFPRNEKAPVPVEDQMFTVWPVDSPNDQRAKQDDCDFVLDHYDLVASQLAMADAQKQNVSFEGAGPYLVGWSPSKARGIPDALVLFVDMSVDNTQADIDNKFRFWKTKIVENPSLWRNGWSIEGVRAAIHNFADEYGQAILDAIKLVGDKKS